MGDRERTGDVGRVGQKRSRSPTSNRRTYPSQGSTSQPAATQPQGPSIATGQHQLPEPSSFPFHDHNLLPPAPPRSPQSPLSLVPSHPPPPPPPLKRTPLHPALIQPPPLILPYSYAPSPSSLRPSTPPAIYTPRQTLASSQQASSSGRINWPTTKRRKAGNPGDPDMDEDDDEQGAPPAGGCREARKGNPGDPDMDGGGGSSNMEID